MSKYEIRIIEKKHGKLLERIIIESDNEIEAIIKPIPNDWIE